MPEWMKNALLAVFAVVVLTGAAVAVKDGGGSGVKGTEAAYAPPALASAPASPTASPTLVRATCDEEQKALERASIPSGAGPSVVFLGDSYTYGLGAPRGADYASLVARAEGWRAARLGLVGSGFIAYRECGQLPLRSQTQRVVSLHPDVIVVQSGLNDERSGDSASSVASAARSLLRSLRAQLPAATVLLVGPAAPMASDAPRVADLDNALRVVASAQGDRYVSWMHVLDAAGAVSADGTHPSPTGHSLLAEAVEQAAKP